MRIVIFEDEKLASERLIQVVKEIDVDAEILACLKSIEAATLWLNNNPLPDLIISDIQLLDGLSFEIFDQMSINCPVIFTTAYDEYAIKAFEVNSIDYLLKPIQKEKLALALNKFAERSASSTSFFDLAQVKSLITPQQTYKTRFLVKLGPKIKAVAIEKIAYFFSQDKLSYLVSYEGEKLPLDHTLEELEQLIDPKAFFRVNRKFIVHFDAVQLIHSYFKGRVKIELKPSIDEDIVISSEKTPVFKKWLDQ